MSKEIKDMVQFTNLETPRKEKPFKFANSKNQYSIRIPKEFNEYIENTTMEADILYLKIGNRFCIAYAFNEKVKEEKKVEGK